MCEALQELQSLNDRAARADAERQRCVEVGVGGKGAGSRVRVDSFVRLRAAKDLQDTDTSWQSLGESGMFCVEGSGILCSVLDCGRVYPRDQLRALGPTTLIFGYSDCFRWVHLSRGRNRSRPGKSPYLRHANATRCRILGWSSGTC